MARPNCVQENATRNERPMPRRVASPRRQDVCRAECYFVALSLRERICQVQDAAVFRLANRGTKESSIEVRQFVSRSETATP